MDAQIVGTVITHLIAVAWICSTSRTRTATRMRVGDRAIAARRSRSHDAMVDDIRIGWAGLFEAS
jgi:hypothetical protein